MTSPPEAAHTLALAMTASSRVPLLLLDEDLTVLAASKSFCDAFTVDPAGAKGCSLFKLGKGEWNILQLKSLLQATAAGNAEIEGYEIDFGGAGDESRHLVLNAQKLDYDGGGDIRLLVTVADVTEARLSEKLRDDLLRDKAVLLQELQHRVANSLQIIASVLMQSARKVSADVRPHLIDAHSRVMSVAALQRQLAMSQLGDVALRGYFTELCNSIGASMIGDHDQLSLAVTIDDSKTSPDVSVSLGLIVTELVINALKHAFPDHRRGKITVDYQSQGLDWTLSVGDDGVGMPKTGENAKAGLGTSIVSAIARQLDADIRIDDMNPGTSVVVGHVQSKARAASLHLV